MIHRILQHGEEVFCGGLVRTSTNTSDRQIRPDALAVTVVGPRCVMCALQAAYFVAGPMRVAGNIDVVYLPRLGRAARQERWRWSQDAIFTKSLSIHVGLHRTGTTTLQHNLGHCIGKNVMWWVPEVSETEPLTKSARLVSLSERIRIDPEASLAQSLISSECILGDYRNGYKEAQSRMNQLREMFEPLEPQVFVTYRNAESWVRSCYSDYVLTGGKQSFSKFRELVEPDGLSELPSVIGTIQRSFLDVHLIATDQVDIFDGFFQVWGMNYRKYSGQGRIRRLNKSPTPAALEVIRKLNVLGAREDSIQTVLAFLDSPDGPQHFREPSIPADVTSDADVLQLLVQSTRWNSSLKRRLPSVKSK